MKNIYKLIVAILGCQAVGLLGSVFTVTSIPTWYATLNKPPFAPPNWIFGPVWTILYLLMGISFFLIWKQKKQSKKHKLALKYFLYQLAANFLWSPLFFGLKSPFLGLVGIIVMWVLIVKTIKNFYALSKISAYLLIPYLLWVSFATLLNASILILN